MEFLLGHRFNVGLKLECTIPQIFFCPIKFANLRDITQVRFRGGGGVTRSKRGSLCEKMTKMVADQPQICWSSPAQPCDQITGIVVSSTACNILRDLARTRTKKATIALLPCDQKLTDDKTKWDSAHKFGTASTAKYKKMMSR